MLKFIRHKTKHHTRPIWSWLKLLWLRIDEDHMTTLAGNLAYVSLLSLVPLIAVIFALFAAFPMFSEVSIQLRHFVFANFIPTTGDVIQRYIEQFVANSSKMTAVGACGLVVTSLLLMYSIDSALNSIWRSTRVRPRIYSFAVYWMILTLGPLLAGASLAISSYLLSLRWASGLNGAIDNMLRVFPLILSWISFWLLYSIVPTTRVPNRDAVIGAFVAALLFEAGKKGLRFISPHFLLTSSFMACWRWSRFCFCGSTGHGVSSCLALK
jgi:membrane protein